MNKSNIKNLSFPEFMHGFYSVADTQRRIRDVAPSWLEARYAESSVIVALPKVDEIPWHNVFNWNPSDYEAERILTEACGDGRRLGINQHNFVESAYLFNASKFDPQLKVEMKHRGWTTEDLDQISLAESKADDVRHRMRGAAGWFLCQPRFLSERDKLMEAWKELKNNSRPELPLLRTIRVPQQPVETRKARSSARLSFQQQFDEFCDRWRLQGMLMWELPKLDGPKWTEHYPGRPETREGEVCFDTPFHFPLQVQDELGKWMTESHQELATDRGFNDQSKWETYAQLLRLSFWENVIDQRYANFGRVRGYVTKKLEILAALLDLDVERTRKLRTLCNKLRSGQVSDLSDYR